MGYETRLIDFEQNQVHSTLAMPDQINRALTVTKPGDDIIIVRLIPPDANTDTGIGARLILKRLPPPTPSIRPDGLVVGRGLHFPEPTTPDESGHTLGIPEENVLGIKLIIAPPDRRSGAMAKVTVGTTTVTLLARRGKNGELVTGVYAPDGTFVPGGIIFAADQVTEPITFNAILTKAE